jgi:hypothetical protein
MAFAMLTLNRPVLVEHRPCIGADCDDCNSNGEIALGVDWLVTLAHNLAIGSALCEAFYDGFRAANGPRPLQCRPGRNLARVEPGGAG